MPNSTQPIDTIVRDEPYCIVPLALAVQKTYKGCAAAIVLGTGYGTPLVASSVATQQFVGVFTETYDNTAGTAGGYFTQLIRSGIVMWAQTGTTIAAGSIGEDAFFSDDHTVTLTSGTQFAGVVCAVDASGNVYVDITTAVLSTVDVGNQTHGSVISGGVAQDTYSVSATQNYPLGTVREFSDGRKFRYALAAATAITRGLMQQSAALNSNFADITQTSTTGLAIGATAITVACSSATIAANYFAGGRLMVVTGTNIGDSYPIVSSAAVVATTTIGLVLGEPLRNAIAATDKVTLIPNRWQSTIVVPATTATGAAAGIPLVDVALSNYYWAQTKGLSPAICTGTLVVGGKCGITATAGTVGPVASTAYALPFYGTVISIGTTTEATLINLELE